MNNHAAEEKGVYDYKNERIISERYNRKNNVTQLKRIKDRLEDEVILLDAHIKKIKGLKQ